MKATFEADFSNFRREAESAVTSLKAIEAESAQVNSVLGSMVGLAGQFAVGLFGTFGVEQVLSFTKALISQADALQKSADMTGLNVEALQRLQYVGDETSVSINDMTRAIDQMEKRLASGNNSVLDGLKRMHLTLDDLRGLSPEQQFYAVAEAMQHTTSQNDQMTAAMELFGSTGARVLPAIKHGFDDVKASSIGMSQDTVSALDQVGDALSHLARGAESYAATGLAKFFNAFTFGALSAQTAVEALATATANAFAKAPPLPTMPGATGAAPTISVGEARTAERELEKERLEANRELQKQLQINRHEMEEYAREEWAAFQIGQKLIADGNKLLDEQNAKMAKRLEMQTAFVASLILESQQAKEINTERNLGPAIPDRAAEAARQRDLELSRIESARERAPAFDFGPMIQKIWQDFDAAILQRAKGGTGAVPVGTTIQSQNINVNGVLDPRTINELAAAVGAAMMRQTGRQYPSA